MPLSSSLPLPKNDLIDGKDFLSFFINQDDHHSSDHHQFYLDEDHVDKNKTNEFPTTTIEFEPEILTSSTVSTAPNDDEIVLNDNNIVKLVTSGSKIIFLEEISMPSSEQPYVDEPNKGTMKEEASAVSINDEIKIVSVSTSSSERRSIESVYRTDSENIGDPKTNILNSNVRKSDFSIEETEPVTIRESKDHQKVSDSSKEESVHIESIVSSPLQSARRHPKQHTSQADDDDALSSIQAIALDHEPNRYHHKEGSAKPRSVSYSSLTQQLYPRGRHHYNSNRDFNSHNTNNSSSRQKQQHVSEPAKVFSEPSKIYSEASKVYSVPSKVYSEPSKVYSKPSEVYSVPEKVYSEPSKIYSEPARVYSEVSKVYSKPSRVYGVPSKVYSEPAKVYSLPPTTSTTTTSTTTMPSIQSISRTTNTKKVIFNLDKLPYDLLNAPAVDDNSNYLYAPHLDNQRFHQVTKNSNNKNTKFNSFPKEPVETTTAHHIPTPEQNYEIDEAVSVMTNGRTHGIQAPTSSPAKNSDDIDPKVGYVVEGRNFRKYRVEEKTSDGFIVGEYGVVSNNDGSLRGVRYTADSNINPNLIYEALMKFLSL